MQTSATGMVQRPQLCLKDRPNTPHGRKSEEFSWLAALRPGFKMRSAGHPSGRRSRWRRSPTSACSKPSAHASLSAALQWPAEKLGGLVLDMPAETASIRRALDLFVVVCECVSELV